MKKMYTLLPDEVAGALPQTPGLKIIFKNNRPRVLIFSNNCPAHWVHRGFAKKRGLNESDMCRSEYVYKKLRRFRAGIESGISWLKRSFGLTRCTWKGFDSFKCYVLASVVAANLLTMARKKLAAA